MTSLRVIGRTTAGNLIRFGSGFIYAFVLPPLLIDRIGQSEYAAWVLVNQIPLYIAFLEVGMSTAVTKFIAPHRMDARPSAEVHRIMRAAVVVQGMLGLLGFGVALVVAGLLPVIFTSIPSSSVEAAQYGVVVVGGAAGIGLVSTALLGYFNGVQRNFVPSSAQLAVRVAAAAGVVLVSGFGLGAMFTVAALGLFVNLAMQLGLFVRDAKQTPFPLRPIERHQLRVFASYCSTLVVWSLAGFLVGGLDTTVVGIVDFDATTAFSLAVSATAVMLAAHNSLLASFIPEVSANAGEEGRLQHAFEAATRWGGLALALAVAGYIAFGPALLDAWLGESLADEVYPLLNVLVLANAIRLVMVPYVVTLIGTGEHHRVRLSPIVEGVVNIVVSVTLGITYGAMGVAVGTLIGGIAGALLHLILNMPRTQSFSVDRRRFLSLGLVRPMVALAPLAAFALVPRVVGDGMAAVLAIDAALAVLAGLLVYVLVLDAEQRSKLVGRTLMLRRA